MQFLSGSAQEVFGGGWLASDVNLLLEQLSPGKCSPYRTVREVWRALKGKQVVGVFSDDGHLVGMATLTDTSTLSGQRVLVDDVVVLEEYRGNGIGQVLMDKVEELARQMGASTIELTSKPERVAANEMYLKLGYEKRNTNCYRKRLD